MNQANPALSCIQASRLVLTKALGPKPSNRLSSLMLTFCGIFFSVNASVVLAQGLPAANRCSSVQPGGDIAFRQVKLREIADISNPEIRRINALMSARCYEEATAAYSKFAAANPNDYKIRFVEGRMLWIFKGTGPARQAMTVLIKEHPDFASAKVLMASLHLDANEFDQARNMLDQAAKNSPNDLWLFLDQLKLERLAPTADTAKKFLEILRNSQFPPSAREMAGLNLTDLPGLTSAMVEEAYKTALTFESTTPYAMKATNLAVYLVAIKQLNPAQTVNQIKTLIADPRSVSRAETLDHLLRIAYLQQAAAIDPNSSEKNAKWVSLARDGANVEELQTYMLSTPVLTPQMPLLKRFLQLKIDQKAMDQYGYTELCRAVSSMDVNSTLAALNEGADPNVLCKSLQPLGIALSYLDTSFIPQRKQVIRTLLEHGADVTSYLTICDQSVAAYCKTEILPLLREFAAKKR
jgi:tetratricopeptide (TPR) repeat protein